MAEHHMSVDDGGTRRKSVPVEYPSNSKKAQQEQDPPKPEKEKVQSVITGKVHRKSRAGSVVAETSRSVLQYVMTEVLAPSLKEMLYDVITGGTQRAIYGETRARSAPTGYNRMSRPGAGGPPPTNPYTQHRTVSRHARATHTFDEIILETRDEADSVLDALREIIKVYDQASVGDMLELCNITSTFTDAQWGWTDLRDARIQPTRGGYLLRMPNTVPIAT
jgi:hypothetical protein